MKGPYDGRLVEYIFGPETGVTRDGSWRVEALTLKRAIRMFRVGVLYPHQYSDGRIETETMGSRGRPVTRYLSSDPGSKVLVRVRDKKHHQVQKTWGDGELMFCRPGSTSSWKGEPEATEPVMEWVAEWVTVAEIDPEDPESEYSPTLLPGAIHEAASGMLGSDSTALAHPTSLTGLALKTRPDMAREIIDLESLQGDIEAKRSELEQQKMELQQQVAAMHRELEKRMEQVWFIELFLGSKEEVKMLRPGSAAPAGTKITVYQRVLCMDEEIAVHTWVHEPETIGDFDYQNLEDFDRWLLDDPAHLDLVLPAQKGIRALRVRRRKKHRENFGNLALAFRNVEKETLDQMVYLLIRNGEQLYRLWVDVNVWPRFFPRVDEWDWMERERVIELGGRAVSLGKKGSPEAKVDGAKKFLAGLVVVQGLVLRSDLFHPLPEGAGGRLDIFDSRDVGAHFSLVRDDEAGGNALTDGSELSKLTWREYEAWLNSRVEDGALCFWVKPRSWSYGEIEDRVPHKTVRDWPDEHLAYVVEGKDRWSEPREDRLSFLYLPGDEIWAGESWGLRPRKRRVRFQADIRELWPCHSISWRVVEHLIQDRGQRKHYEGFFLVFSRWREYCLAQRERELPFVDAVLQGAGHANPRMAPEEERARAERLLRWWKVKNHSQRELGEDEAKALRMVSAAFKRGDDHDEDPEAELFRELGERS